MYLSKNEKKICVNAAKALGLEFAGVDLMRERGKPYGKTESCYVTEVNGNPGTGIIDVTQHNHFVDLIKYIASRKVNKVKPKGQSNTADAQTSALSSYPTDMIHTNMTPQQAIDAVATSILNEAMPEKVACIGALAKNILSNASESEPKPALIHLTKIAINLHMEDDPRYEAFTTSMAAPTIKPSTNPPSNRVELSEASTYALAEFKRKAVIP